MTLQKLLGFDKQKMSVRVEVIGGLTTFLTMCYILAVNPAILSTTGMDKAALFTGTAVAAGVATVLLAFMSRLPFAQAPSMGLNAFFAFTLCQAMGLTWQQALAVLLVEGIFFILITLLNVRDLIMQCIPNNLRYAISAGIGMFIAFIGLKNAHIIVADPDTFVRLGRFSNECLLGIFSILFSGLLMVRGVKGALFYSILIATVVAIPMGVVSMPESWSPVSIPHSMAPVFCQFDFSAFVNPETGFFNLKMIMVIFSLLLVNIFDTLGTLVALVQKTGHSVEGKETPEMKRAMMSDAIGTTVGAFLGSSTITTYIESASGVAEGARSGLTALVVGALFFISIFFAPLFLLIPAAATSGALVMVGVLMVDSVKKINLEDVSESFPAFITMITMVLCYSIADGICLGILSYVIIKLCAGKWKNLNVTLVVLALLFIINYALG